MTVVPVDWTMGDAGFYYETMVDDVPAKFDCRGHDENVIPFMDALLVLE